MAKKSQKDLDSEEPQDAGSEEELGSDLEEEEEESDGNDAIVAAKPKKVFKLTLTETEDFNKKLQKRGCLYIARIPPRMTPTKVKSLLSEFGEVTRVYLVEEDATVRKRRKKFHGGSGGKRYIEGWVEFSDKRKAKHVALSLNNTPISNQKRNPHHGDLWNIKYLNKFKWSHLTEKVAYERRVREQKLRVEMMQARRENASYVQMVETGKKLDKIEARKRKRGETGDVIAGDGKSGDEKKRHKHRQMKPLKDGSDRAAKRALLGSLV